MADCRVVLADLLSAAGLRLQNALSLERGEARLEARILAARALGVDRAWLIAHDRETVDEAAQRRLETLIARRATGEPVAYILGEKEFYGRVFKVTPDVLIPRPETELLVDAALARLPQDRPARILDLGTGSGCIAITLALERPDCTVIAVDASSVALETARKNARRLGADVGFLLSDWFASVSGKFDLIVSNPPYVAEADRHLHCSSLTWEPLGALKSGPEGLDAIARIAACAGEHMADGASLCLEHGWDQAVRTRELLAGAGFSDVKTLTDLAGHSRLTLACR